MHDKLVKLLSLTTSSNDAEALAAIRKANQLLDQRGLRWPDILKVSEIDEMFMALKEAKLTPSTQNLIDSLFEQWTAKHSLSPKQLSVLRKVYNRQPPR